MKNNKYRLCYDIENKEYLGNDVVEIGKVIELPSDDEILFIFYDRSSFSKYNLHFSIHEWEASNGKQYPIVVVDDVHRNTMFEKPEIFLALCMHELGHYKNGDIFNSKNASSEEYAIIRYRAIMNGVLMDEEANADAYAARCLGKPAVMRSIEYLISARKKRNDPGAELAIKEFELRIKALKKLTL